MKSINPLILFTALILNRCTIIGLTGGILIDKTQHYELDHPKYDQVQLESKVPIVLTDYSDESKNGRFSKAVLLPDSSYNRIFSAAASKNDSLKMLFCLQDTILINGQLHLLSGYEYSAIRTIRISDQDSVYMDLENFEFFVEGKGDTIKSEYLKNLMQTGKVPYNWSLFYHGKNGRVEINGSSIRQIAVKPYSGTPFITMMAGLAIDYYVFNNIDFKQ